jgi:HAD superfamily hydrolase (TIGR01509 family)
LLDLGHVAFEPNTSVPACLVKRIKQYTYRFFEHVQPYHPDEIVACDDQGPRLPQLMCDWQKGVKSAAQIKKFVLQRLKDDQSYFTLQVQKSLVLYVTHRIFTPESVAQSLILNTEVMKLITFCKENGFAIIIASNFAPAEFDLLKQKHSSFFDQCDGFHVSGHVGTMKPDPEFFRKILSQYNLIPEECILIDDRIENRQAARELGIKAFFKEKTTYPYKGPVKTADFDACIQFIEKQLAPVFPPSPRLWRTRAQATTDTQPVAVAA